MTEPPAWLAAATTAARLWTVWRHPWGAIGGGVKPAWATTSTRPELGLSHTALTVRTFTRLSVDDSHKPLSLTPSNTHTRRGALTLSSCTLSSPQLPAGTLWVWVGAAHLALVESGEAGEALTSSPSSHTIPVVERSLSQSWVCGGVFSSEPSPPQVECRGCVCTGKAMAARLHPLASSVAHTVTALRRCAPLAELAVCEPATTACEEPCGVCTERRHDSILSTATITTTVCVFVP